MGDVGQTIFGGSKQSQNSSSRDLAYPALAQSLGSSVGATGAGTNYLGALLGIPGYGGSGGTPAPAPATGGGNPFTSGPSSYTGPSLQEIMAMKNDGIPGNYRAALAAYQAFQRQNAGGTPTPTPAPTPTPPPTSGGGGTGQQNALQTFADSGGMKFLQNNANRMIDNNQAAKGLLQSGSTLKGISDYNQGLASTYLDRYLNNVINFSKLGQTSASILSDAGRVSSGTGSGSSKPGILGQAAQAGAEIAAAG